VARYINDNEKLDPGTGYLVMVRHGQSMGNAWEPAYLNPQMNFLTELGSTQAKLAGLKLKETGIEFDTMITSGIVRARHTLSIIAHTLENWHREFIVDERFNERIPAGGLHGPSEGPKLGEQPETKQMHLERVSAGFAELVQPVLEQRKSLLLVSHYYTMQVLIRHLGVNRDRLWGGGDHIPNGVPFIWNPDQPEKIVVLNDETRVPKY
jgi:broad specificity phosphatase PhoE